MYGSCVGAFNHALISILNANLNFKYVVNIWSEIFFSEDFWRALTNFGMNPDLVAYEVIPNMNYVEDIYLCMKV